MRKRATGILLFCVFLLAAIVAGYLDMLNSERERLAQLGTLETAGEGEGEAPASVATTPAAPSEAEARLPLEAPGALAEPQAPSEAEAPAGGAQSEAPSFDVLRAEPNGDLVVAGRAPAGATVALMGNGREIARETAGEGGSFAMVLPEPLTPGAHQLALSATMPDGRQAASRQTALVDVPPAGEADRLLAMIEEPNAPARLVELPKAAEPAGGTSASAPVIPDPAGEASAAAQASALSRGETGAGVAAPAGAASPMADEAPAVAAAEPPAGDGADASPLPAVSPLVVEAVEIENGRVFVAGTAARGSRVRVYLDNALIGEASVTADGRFLVTAARDVPVGDRSVRADQVAADGTVAFRAEVPFARPDEGAMSAVASSAAPAAPAGAAVDDAPPDAAAGEPSTDVAALSEPERPSVETASGDAATVPEEPVAPPPAEAPATSPPGDADRTIAAQAPAPLPTAPDENAGMATAPEPSPPAANEPSQDVATIVQAPLTAVEGRVIIRRGDSLWRISRELYGAGRRYTVIYLANGDQIRDPDRIYPGQVFRVPDGAEGEAENEG